MELLAQVFEALVRSSPSKHLFWHVPSGAAPQDTRLVFANDAALDILGCFSAGSTLGQGDFEDVVTDEGPLVGRLAYTSATEGKSWHVSNQQHRGRIYHIDVLPMGGGMAATILVDSTKNARAAAQHQHDLEQTVYTLSHDLRKPLRHMTGFAEALVEDYADVSGLDARAHQYIGEMVGAAKRMERLLDGILQFARLGTLDENVEVDLEQSVADVIADNGFDLAGVPHSFFVQSMPLVYGSHRLIYQLFGNLIGNAVKFRDPERDLEIHIRAERLRDRVFVDVIDNGVGIPSAFREEAFRLFRRVGPQAQVTEGMGLGLAVCKRIVEAHGGHIFTIGSEIGGTRVRFDLPAARPSEPPCHC